MKDRIKVLFVCIHNSARSQMAEAFLKHIAGDRFEAESAGLEPGTLNQTVVKSMKEAGIDISGNKTKSVFDLHKQGRKYDYVITVCDKEAAERCPVFPGDATRIHWGFRDPVKYAGPEDEKLRETSAIRDEIRDTLEKWVKSLK